jgi:hypothetical protein
MANVLRARRAAILQLLTEVSTGCGVFDLVHAQAVSCGELGATDPKNLITCIGVGNCAVQGRDRESLFNDAGHGVGITAEQVCNIVSSSSVHPASNSTHLCWLPNLPTVAAMN